MKLQLAWNPDLTGELELAGRVAAYVDLIEAGTPLLIREGIRAVGAGTPSSRASDCRRHQSD